MPAQAHVPHGQVPPAGYTVPAGAVPPGYPGYAGYPGYPGYPPRPIYPPAPLAPNGQPLADFFNRLGAYLIDALIMGGINFILILPFVIWWVVAFMTEVETISTSNDPQVTLDDSWYWQFFLGYLLLVGVLLLISLAVSYLYLVEFTWRSGQTIGKRMLKLKIVPADPAAERTRGMLAKRWLVEQVGGVLIPFFSYVDGLWQLWDKPLQQCLHDKAAKTVVVKIG